MISAAIWERFRVLFKSALFCTFNIELHEYLKTQGKVRFLWVFWDFSYHCKRAKFWYVFDVRDKKAFHIPWRLFHVYIFSSNTSSTRENKYEKYLVSENMSKVMCFWLGMYVTCNIKSLETFYVPWRKRAKIFYLETRSRKQCKFGLKNERKCN